MRWYKANQFQYQLWIACKSYKNVPLYNIGFCYELTGQVDVKKLKSSLMHITNLHDPLRSGFQLKNGHLYQFIIEDCSPYIEEVDFSNDEQQKNKLNKYKSDFFYTPFKLSVPGLARYALVKISEDKRQLLLLWHHLIIDAFSVKQFLKELGESYSSAYKLNVEQGNKNSPLLPLTHFGTSNIRDYWRNKLSNIDASFALPQYSSNKLSKKAIRHKIYVGAPTSNSLVQFIDKQQCTLFEFVSTLCLVILFRFSHAKTEFILGYSKNDRTRTKNWQQFGYQVNTLPLKISVEHNLSFLDLLSKVKDERAQNKPYQSIFLKDIINIVRQEQPEISNLFDLIINQYTYFLDELNMDGIKSRQIAVNEVYTNTPMTIMFDLIKNRLTFEVEYQQERFDQSTVWAVFEALKTLPAGVLSYPDKPISSLSIRGKTEQVYQKVNSTNVNLPNIDISSLISKTCEKYTNKIAIEDQKNQLTFKEIDQQSNWIAKQLQRCKVGRNNLVPVIADRSWRYIVTVIGILKAGAGFVPISKDSTIQNIRKKLNSLTFKIIIICDDNRALVEQFAGFDVIAYTSKIDTHHVTVKYPTLNKKQDAAYAIFTSGTTGDPKCAVNTRIGLVNRLTWAVKDINLKSSDCLCFKTPISFDVSIWEFMLPLLTGAKAVIIPPHKEIDMLFLCQYIKRFSITIIHFVPSVFEHFINYISFKYCSSLRYVVCSGESLHQSTVNYFFSKLPNKFVELKNYYGPAETAIDVTAYTCLPDQSNSEAPIGYPIDNVQIEILDKYGSAKPLGAKGELCITGICLGSGYLDKKDNQAFHFNKTFNKRFYYTGDIVSLSKDGLLHFHGRNNQETKRYGQRINLSSIQSKIKHMADIVACCVTQLEIKKETYLVVFYVSQNNKIIERVVFDEYLSHFFVRSVIPDQYCQINKLPYTYHGKVDIPYLQNIFKKQQTNQQKHYYKDEGYSLVGNLWRDFLQTSTVTSKSNFFTLGGDSLLAIKLSSEIYKQAGVTIGANEILSNPTFESLSQKFQQRKQPGAQHYTSSNYYDDDKSRSFYLSSQQQKVWHACQKSHIDGVYNIPVLFKQIKNLDLDKFKKAINKLLDKHIGLKINVKENYSDNCLIQQVNYNHKLEPIYSSLSVERLIDEAYKPFDITKELLVRCYLNQTKYGWQILWVFHHLAIDDWSLQIFFRDLNFLYNNPSLGLKHDIPYKACLNSISKNTSIDEENNLISKPGTQILHDHFNKEYSFYGGILTRSPNKNLCSKLDLICKKLQISKFSFLFSNFTLLLSRLTNDSKVAINTIIANRNKPYLANVIGFLSKTVTIEVDIDERQALKDFFVQQNMAIQEQLSHKREASLNICFVYLKHEQLELKINNQSLEAELIHLNTSKFDLTFYVYEKSKEGTLDFVLEYSKGFYCTNTAHALLNQFESLFKRLIEADEDKQIISLYEPGLVEITPQKVVPKFKNLALKLINNVKTKHIEDKIAIKSITHSLTYKQLIDQAASIANSIRSIITPGDYVAFLQEKDINAVVCMLGIIMADAVYVPLSYHMPKSRRIAILHEANVKLFLTDTDKEETAASYITLPFSKLLKTRPYLCKKNFNLSNSIAYILFTSGTTGSPKGIKVSHKNMLNLILQTQYEFQLDESDIWSSCHSITFDYAMWEIWGALLSGATLILTNFGQQRDIDSLLLWLTENKVSILSQTPTSLKQILQLSQFNNWLYQDSSRYIFVGGEKFYPKMLNNIWEKLQDYDVNVVNMFGTTECTVHSTVHFVSESDLSSSLKSPIGQPLPGTGLFILDRYNRIAGPLCVGELCVLGEGVSLGYINNDCNKEFCKLDMNGNQYSTYKTGDYAYYANRCFYYCFRTDNQVKVRGYRIHLNEIEAHIKSLSPKSEVAVFTEARQSCQYLVAALTKSYYSSDELKSRLQKRLPTYMIPNHILFFSKLPKTINNKVDRATILQCLNPSQSTSFENMYLKKPEDYVLAAFQNILQSPTLSLDDNIFASGADSITVMQVASLLRKKSLQVNMHDFYQKETIRDLSESITFSAGLNDTYLPETIPLSPISMCFLSSEQANFNHWCQFVTWQIQQDWLTTTHLREFCNYLLARHGILRYLLSNQTPLQWQHQSKIGNLIYVSEYKKEENNLKRIIQEASEQINCYTGPIMHLALIKTDRKTLLVWVTHHLYIDGVSWRHLYIDFKYFLENKLETQGKNLLDNKFCLWNIKLRETNHHAQWQIQYYYWQKCLTWPSPFHFDQYKHESYYRDVKEESIIIKPNEVSQLKHVLQAKNLDFESILLAILVQSIYVQTFKPSFSIDIESHGRDPNASPKPPEDSLGWMTAIYPLKIREADNPIIDQAHKVKQSLDEVPHSGMGYLINQYLIESLDKEPKLKDISFNFLGIINSLDNGPFWVKEGCGFSSELNNKRRYVIEINSFIIDGTWEVYLQYDPNFYQESKARELKNLLSRKLQYFIQNHKNISSQTLVSNYKATPYKIGPMQKNLLSAFGKEISSYHFNIVTWELFEEIEIKSYLESWIKMAKNIITFRIIIDNNQQVHIQNDITDNFLKVLDISKLADNKQLYINQLVKQTIKEPLQTDVAPLCKLYIVKLDSSHYKFILKMHQMLLDGWSVGPFFTKLKKLYTGKIHQNDIDATTLKDTQCYYNWLENFSPCVVREAFWSWINEKELNNYQNKIKPKSNDYCYGMKLTSLSDRLNKRIQALAKHLQLTSSHFYLAIWALLNSYIFSADQEELLIGIMDANRKIEQYPEIEQKIGMFSSLLPLKVKIKKNLSFQEAWQLIQKNRLESSKYSASTLEEIMLANKELINEGLPFTNLFNYQKQTSSELEETTTLIMQNLQVFEKAHVPLGLRVIPSKYKTDLKITYQQDIFCEQQVGKFFELFCELAEYYVKNPTSSLAIAYENILCL